MSRRMYGQTMIQAFPRDMEGAAWVAEKSTKVVLGIADALRALPTVERPRLRGALIAALTLDAWVHDRAETAEIAVADVILSDASEGLDLWSDLMRDSSYSERAAIYRRSDAANAKHWSETDREDA